ncbi:MAG: GNAT family N-acetyltransferase [Salinirussus sp.]
MADIEIRRVCNGGSMMDAREIRQAVFVDGQDVPPEIEYDGRDESAWHVVAYEGDKPVGTARLRDPEPGVAKIERVAVRASDRGRGIGRLLMAEIENLARKEGLEEAVLHAQTRVEGFYEKLGYERTSAVFEEAGIPHVEMRKYLRRSEEG